MGSYYSPTWQKSPSSFRIRSGASVFPRERSIILGYRFWQNHTQCTLFGPDAYCESRSFPWGVNRLLTALSRAIQQEGIAISEQQLTTIERSRHNSTRNTNHQKKRRMVVVAKQLQTSSLSQTTYTWRSDWAWSWDCATAMALDC